MREKKEEMDKTVRPEGYRKEFMEGNAI